MYARSLSDLRESRVHLDDFGMAGVLAVLPIKDRHFSLPVLLCISPERLRDHVREAAADTTAVFPDVTPDVAAYYLVLEHVLVALNNGADSGSTIKITDGTVDLLPKKPLSPPGPADGAGDLYWSSE